MRKGFTVNSNPNSNVVLVLDSLNVMRFHRPFFSRRCTRGGVASHRPLHPMGLSTPLFVSVSWLKLPAYLEGISYLLLALLSGSAPHPTTRTLHSSRLDLGSILFGLNFDCIHLLRFLL